jgi:hypothetical protein
MHLFGQGCPKCKGGVSYNTIDFITNSILTHGNRYDYSLVNYINSRTPVCIICREHGEFWQLPGDHYSGCGCTKCIESSGERQIRTYLEANGIGYSPQKRFTNLRGCGDKALPFDFYIPKHNLLIEYDGRQHFIPVDYFGGESGLTIVQEHDRRKTKYCADNGVRLLRIPYTIVGIDIDSVLKSALKI